MTTITKNDAKAASSPAKSLTEVASVMKTDKQIANAKKKAEKAEAGEEDKEQTFGPRAIMRKLARAKNPFVGIFVRNELLKATAKTLAACNELKKLKVEITGTLFEPVEKVAQAITNKLNAGSLIDLAKGEEGAATSSACFQIMKAAVANQPSEADIIKRLEGSPIDGRTYARAIKEAGEILELANKPAPKAEVEGETKK